MNGLTEAAQAIRSWMAASMTRSMHDTWRYAKRTGLSMPQFGLLRRLYHGGACEVHEIGQHFDVSSAAASQLVDRLVQSGLVARTENPDDRRTRQVDLTAKGRAIVEKANEESFKWLDALAAELTPAQRAAVLGTLPALVEAEARLPRKENDAERPAIRTSR
jgi:DNA-binding MarR family transcriptional regulator